MNAPKIFPHNYLLVIIYSDPTTNCIGIELWQVGGFYLFYSTKIRKYVLGRFITIVFM